MARAKQGGVVRGGGIDPYTTAMSQQRSEQKSRMREAAVKEKGATKRTGMQTEAGVAQTNIQAAAQVAMQDRRAAESERGRREDQEFQKMIVESNQRHTLKRDSLLNELANAREQRRLDLIKELGKKLDAEARARDLTDETVRRNQEEMAFNIGEANSKAETAKEKVASLKIERLTKHQQMRKMSGVAAESAITKLLDPSFEYNPKEMPEGGLDYAKAALTHGVSPVAWVIPGVTRKGVKESIAEVANNVKVTRAVNDLLKSNGVGVADVNMLNKKNIGQFEELIKEGKITSEDFVPLRASLSRAREAFVLRAETSYGKKDEAAGRFNTDWAGRLLEAENMLRGLNDSKVKLAGDDTATVGSIARLGNSWSEEEYDDTWFEKENAQIASDLRMSLDEYRRRQRLKPGVVTRDSFLLTEKDRSNKLLMDIIAEDENFAVTRMPQIFSPDPVDMAGEMGGY